MSVVSRIEWAAEQAGIGKRQVRTELAAACGISYQSVSQWFTGKTKEIDADNLLKVAKRLNVPLEWLLNGRGSPSRDGNGQSQKSGMTNTVALLGKSDVHDWLAFHKGDTIQSPQVIEELSTNMQLPENAFAITQDSDAMLPEYRSGDDVFFDPSTTAVPEDVVAASINGGDLVILEYREIGLDHDGKMVFDLVPLNSAFPSYRSDRAEIRVLGVQCEHRRYKRRAR